MRRAVEDAVFGELRCPCAVLNEQIQVGQRAQCGYLLSRKAQLSVLLALGVKQLTRALPTKSQPVSRILTLMEAKRIARARTPAQHIKAISSLLSSRPFLIANSKVHDPSSRAKIASKNQKRGRGRLISWCHEPTRSSTR